MSRSEDSKTLREILAGGGRHIGAALAGLVTFPIVARVLDEERLGIWALLGAAAFMLNLSDLGLTNAVNRVAVTPDVAKARRIVALAAAVLCVTIPFAGLVAYFFLLDLPKVAPHLAEDADHAAMVAMVAGGVSAFTMPFRGFVFSRGGVRRVANARTLASVVQVAIIAGGFFLFQSLVVPAVGLLCGYLAELFVTLRAARSIDPELPLRPALPADRGEIKEAFRDGAAQLVINAAVTTALRVDLFVLARVAPLAIVAAYGVAGRAIDQAYLISKQATVALMPRLGAREHRARALRIGTGVFGGVIGSGMAALALCGQPLLVAWVGDVAAGRVPAIVLALLATAAVVMSIYEVASSMVMLSARTGWSCAVPIVIGSATNLTLSILGAPHYGVWAVAGSTIAGNSLTMLLMWWQAKSLLAWPLGRVLSAASPALLAIAVSLGIGWLLRDFAADGFFQSLVACMVTGSAGLASAALVLRSALGRTRGPSIPAPAPTAVPPAVAPVPVEAEAPVADRQP